MIRLRLAEEYDAAQERGEVASDGRPKTVGHDNGFPATAADLGLRRDEIHEARQFKRAAQENLNPVYRFTAPSRAGHWHR